MGVGSAESGGVRGATKQAWAIGDAAGTTEVARSWARLNYVAAKDCSPWSISERVYRNVDRDRRRERRALGEQGRRGGRMSQGERGSVGGTKTAERTRQPRGEKKLKRAIKRKAPHDRSQGYGSPIAPDLKAKQKKQEIMRSFDGKMGGESFSADSRNTADRQKMG